MINKIYSYNGYHYKVLSTGLMKTGVWKRLFILRFLWTFSSMKWIDCVVYESVSTQKVFVRDLKDFKKKFKEVETNPVEFAEATKRSTSDNERLQAK
ncbi:MAG: hypothetical protein JWQ40_2827 [Segetibacter sp.]|nr:hypothetical protein [Segetibacter sp.]